MSERIAALSDKQVDEFMRDFTDPRMSIYDLTRKWQRPSGTIYRWGNIDLGLHRPSLKVDGRTIERDVLASISKGVNAIPVVKIPYPNIARLGQRASLILKLSDPHFGRKTSSFNSEVGIKRLAYLGSEVRRYARNLPPDYYCPNLVAFFEGDFVLGERIGYQVNVEEIEHLIYEQVFELAVPYVSQLLIDLEDTFETIDVYTVKGNHGELGRFQSQSANWDTFVYKIIEQRLANYERINFNIAVKTFYNYADVEDTTFLIVHGDQFKVGGGKPFAGVIDKVMKWKGSMPKKFTHVSAGHFHSKMSFLASDIPVYFNGTFLSDDDWVREVLGLKGSCSQTLLLVVGDKVVDEREIFLEEVQ